MQPLVNYNKHATHAVIVWLDIGRRYSEHRASREKSRVCGQSRKVSDSHDKGSFLHRAELQQRAAGLELRL